ncbi:MAG: low molecular weight phosphotyrosine protein phosphatase [Bacteroidaceae bacterium]|nr:low molecular weight phosphotyrosine protein phosphatase [Bacteroidaceae bacterium]
MAENQHLNKIYSILFVCLGNICRSPAAEGILKKMVGVRGLSKHFFIDSAGIGNWHVGQLPDRRMRRLGAMEGYNFNSYARQVCREDFKNFDYIIAMDQENAFSLKSLTLSESEREKIIEMAGLLQHHPKYHIIPDPYYGNDRDFELVIELLEDACNNLLKKLLLLNNNYGSIGNDGDLTNRSY